MFFQESQFIKYLYFYIDESLNDLHYGKLMENSYLITEI